ncbi:MAG: response regulator [Calditrichaeota bacterium]|nr:response regulator [Calditrichota bacterium]
MERRRILLVEDDPADEALTMRALRRSSVPCEVKIVRDGAEALDYLLCQGHYEGQTLEALPDLVLLDLRLPKIDGLEVLRRIRSHERTKDLKVVVLTASEAEQDLVQAYGLGATSYLRKAVRQLGLAWLLNSETAGPQGQRH